MNGIPCNQQEDDVYGEKPSLVSEINSTKLCPRYWLTLNRGDKTVCTKQNHFCSGSWEYSISYGLLW